MNDQQQIPDPTTTDLAHEAIKTYLASVLLETEREFQLAQSNRDHAREQVEAWDATRQITDEQVITVFYWATDVVITAGYRAAEGQGTRDVWEAASLQLKALDNYLRAIGYDTSPDGLAVLWSRNVDAGRTGRTPTPG